MEDTKLTTVKILSELYNKFKKETIENEFYEVKEWNKYLNKNGIETRISVEPHNSLRITIKSAKHPDIVDVNEEELTESQRIYLRRCKEFIGVK